MPLSPVTITQKQAADWIRRVHRHHAPPQGWIVGVGLATPTGDLAAVGVLGRPVAQGGAEALLSGGEAG